MAAILRPVACLAAAAAVHATVEVPTLEIARGVQMPVMSIGTGGLERADATEIAASWLGLGGRGLDTALMYKNEAAVRQAVNASGVPRDQLFITSKIPGCLLPESSVEADLQQLGVEYIDLMLIHFPSKTGCTKAWSVLEDYHAKGKLRAIGVSNFQEADLQPILDMAKVKPAVNQIEHNVLAHDDATIAFCQQHGIAVEAYSPLGRANHSGDIAGNAVLQRIGASHNRSTYQVALRWIVQHGHLLTFQSTSAAHQASDADVFDFSLTEAEMKTLDSLQGPSVVVV